MHEVFIEFPRLLHILQIHRHEELFKLFIGVRVASIRSVPHVIKKTQTEKGLTPENPKKRKTCACNQLVHLVCALARKRLHQRSKVLQASHPNQRTTLIPYQPYPPCWDLGKTNGAAEHHQVNKSANQVKATQPRKTCTSNATSWGLDHLAHGWCWRIWTKTYCNGATIEHPLAKWMTPSCFGKILYILYTSIFTHQIYSNMAFAL